MTEPKALKVGILGATGAVGEQMMIVLAERNFLLLSFVFWQLAQRRLEARLQG